MGNILSHPASSSKQTQLTFDIVELALTASQSDTFATATGEIAFMTYITRTTISAVDQLFLTVDASNYREVHPSWGATDGFGSAGDDYQCTLGNNQSQSKYTADATCGTRAFGQAAHIIKEEA